MINKSMKNFNSSDILNLITLVYHGYKIRYLTVQHFTFGSKYTVGKKKRMSI